MARSRILVNNQTPDWEINSLGGLVVPASNTLDITGLVSDADIIFAIEEKGLTFSSDRFLRTDAPGGTIDITTASLFCMITKAFENVVLDRGMIEDETVSSTTAVTNQLKLSLSFTPKTPGVYLIQFAFGASQSKTNDLVHVQVIDDTDAIVLMEEYASFVEVNTFQMKSGFAFITFSTTVSKIFSVYFRAVKGSGTASIRRGHIGISRWESNLT